MRKNILKVALILMLITVPNTVSFSAVATESTQLMILAETAQQKVQQLRQLETAILQKEAQLKELINLPNSVFNQFKSQYDRIVGDYKKLINQYKDTAKNIRSMTDRMKNYKFNPSGMLSAMDSTMQMTNKLIQSNIKTLTDYQKTLEVESKQMSAEEQDKEVRNITNVNTGLQTVTKRLASLNTGIGRMTQLIVNQDLEKKAIQQAQKIEEAHLRQQRVREQSAFKGAGDTFNEMAKKRKAKKK